MASVFHLVAGHYCASGCARSTPHTVSRNILFLGRSLQEVLFCLGEIRTIDTILFARRAGLFTKTGCKALEERHFSGAVSSFLRFSPLLSHSPWEEPLLHVWLLRAWWDPGCYSECLKGCYSEAWKKYFSLPHFDSESLNTTGSIQGMMECLTEAAICSQLANRNLFGQWARPIHSANTSFPMGSEKKRGRRSRPPFQTPTPIWDNLSKQNAFVPRVTI